MNRDDISASDAAQHRRGRNKGFAAAYRAQKRLEAEKRQAAYEARRAAEAAALEEVPVAVEETPVAEVPVEKAPRQRKRTRRGQ